LQNLFLQFGFNKYGHLTQEIESLTFLRYLRKILVTLMKLPKENRDLTNMCHYTC